MNAENSPSEQTDSFHRIRWQCRRGLLELDVLLNCFLDTHYNQLPDRKKNEFVQLLKYSDQQLLYWLTDQNTPPTELADIINAIKCVKFQ